MKITDLESFFVKPRWAFLKVSTGEGIVGWGEPVLEGRTRTVWQSAQDNPQGILHRIKALGELRGTHAPSAVEMSELQYEVANLSFQQEVVAKVADKASQAIQTLIKNQ